MAEPTPRLLIVEDHHEIRIGLRQLLVRRGWDVREATTVAEGLGQLDPPPDTVVLDLMLPDGSGEDILHTIRADGLPTRVLVYTAAFDVGRLDVGSPGGPDAVFSKVDGLRPLLQACDIPAFA